VEKQKVSRRTVEHDDEKRNMESGRESTSGAGSDGTRGGRIQFQQTKEQEAKNNTEMLPFHLLSSESLFLFDGKEKET